MNKIINIISLISASSICTSIAQQQPAATKPARKSTTHSQHENPPSGLSSKITQFDFTNKTFKHGNKTHSMSDKNIALLFEVYLITDTLSKKDAIEYRNTIKDILDLLTYKRNRSSRPNLAYKLLGKAAKYPGDAKICKSIANTVYSAQLTTKHILSSRRQIKKLRKERDEITNKLRMLGGHIKLSNPAEGVKPHQNVQSKQMIKRKTEIENTLRTLNRKGIKESHQSKLNFQSMIVQLFAERRFQHCIIATRFYMSIYKGGDAIHPLKKEIDTKKIFSGTLAVNPTINGIEAAAEEAIRKTEILISSFNNNFKNNQIHAASDRLLEAFFIGEFLPALHTIPLIKKTTIQQYIKDANNLVKILESNDLERAEKLSLSLQKQASDYDLSKVKSYIANKKERIKTKH